MKNATGPGTWENPRESSQLVFSGIRPAPPPRTAILASADLSFRQRVRDALLALRWQVREAGGGAEALAHLETAPAEALILDSWLPDLEIGEFIVEFEKLNTGVDLVAIGDLAPRPAAPRSPRRNELLYAMRSAQDAAPEGARGENRAAWDAAAMLQSEPWPAGPKFAVPRAMAMSAAGLVVRQQDAGMGARREPAESPEPLGPRASAPSPVGRAARLPELIGNHPTMLDVSRRIRLVATHATSVLIQGPTGTGKELVARAVHRLSPRAARPFVALNCAAIPEALFESELFGHARGAFTGAVQARTGKIEAAHGGTLFLDEIGEMPLPFQSKLLRFVESGELQRVGENEPVKVDVRIVAATHRALSQSTGQGNFRSDLYYRLSVFLIRTPSLASRIEDLPLLTAHFFERMGRRSPAKSLSSEAVLRLQAHRWPGNVRELEHVLERAWILAEDRPEIGTDELEFGEADDS